MDSVGTIPLRRWTHVTFVAEGKLLQLYINGHLDSEMVTKSVASFNLHNFKLGGVSCYLDDFRVFNRVLSEGDVTVPTGPCLPRALPTPPPWPEPHAQGAETASSPPPWTSALPSKPVHTLSSIRHVPTLD